jgi:transposase
MDGYSEVFVGMDVSKSRIAVALAGGVRTVEVRFLREIEAGDTAVTNFVRRLPGMAGRIAPID